MSEITPDGTSTSSVSANCANSGGSSETQNHFVISKCRRNTDVSVGSNSNNPNQETSDDSEVEERLLVVNCRAGKLGAAYYTLQTGELFLIDEIADRPPQYEMFLNLFRQVDPVRVVMDGKQQGAFVQTVKKTVFSDTSDDPKCKLSFVSAKEYNYEGCKRRIYSLTLPYEPPNCNEEERTMFLRTVVDFNQTQSVHALGALLRYLDLNWSNLNMVNMQSKPLFLSLKRVLLADIVTIDEDTYRGLHIFSPIAHPSGFKKGVRGSNKEGLSLLQIFSKCSSKVGQSRFRILMQHPTTDPETLRRRQDVVGFFLKSNNDAIMRNICSSLKYIKNVNGILAKIKALSAKSFQWKSLYNTLYNAVLICEMCETARGCMFLEELAACDNNKLYEMALYMNRIIDFDLTKIEGKFTVKAGVDSELDMKKQTMASLHGLMSETAKVELERLPPFIEECSMLYMPHLGYLLGVKAWEDNLTPQQKELPDMKFMVQMYSNLMTPLKLLRDSAQNMISGISGGYRVTGRTCTCFQNNNYIHYKSKGCEELDMMIGDTYPEIVAHETLIMMRLTALVLDNLHTLASVIDKCGELDCLIAMSKVAKEFNYVRPTLTNEKLISIKQGRHPLHILNCDNFVPNDTESSLKNGLVKIMTGPNSSGKSVYMKQTGLIVYLTHIGSFVPAESATIGIVDHIYSRIQSTECVAAHMSAFFIDLRQMALALQESTSNSLIIVDEFGKGTSEVDGLALLAASLNTLLFQGVHCPHVLLSTHFLNIKEFIVSTEIVTFLQFEHMLQDGDPVFLFRLTDGATESSFAHQVAAASGIGDDVVKRAAVALGSIINNTLPPVNKRIAAKLKSYAEIIKIEILAEDIY